MSQNNIQVILEAGELFVGRSNALRILLTNFTGFPCTNIVLKISLPPQIALIQGSDRLEIARLESDASHRHTIHIRPKQPGEWMLTSTNFSYRDQLGRSHRIHDWSFKVSSSLPPRVDSPPPPIPPPVKTWDGKMKADLQHALISAFPTSAEFGMFINISLDVNLAAVAGGNNLTEIVFNLILWAIAHGRQEELVTKAHHRNPGNAELIRFIEQYGPFK